MEYGSYRAIKLLEHGMKVLERLLERRLRMKVNVDDMQFGFMSGKGTVDVIFVVRQLQEKFMEKRKDLFYAFVDLENAFNRTTTTTTVYFNEVVFPSVLGLTSPMAFPQHSPPS